MHLQGKTALITGSSQRIGKAIAENLALNGMNLVLHYNHSQKLTEQLAESLTQQYAISVECISADFSDLEQVDGLKKKLDSCGQHIDVIINNASSFSSNNLFDASYEELSKSIKVNACAPLELTKKLLEGAKSAHVINFLDSMIVSYDKWHFTYHVSKRLLADMTRMLAVELAPNIQVNAIAPGSILEPVEKEDTSYLNEYHCPLQKQGDVEEINLAVNYLLSSNFVTGQVLYVDGGRHLRGKFYE